ncbi:MAG: sugar phosphate isomerase/epimerase [Clostridia bacterium]|nr:sugar phosphate isomerase/epimerase [Clostridia bacterium]
MENFGLNLYTLRDYIKTEDMLCETLGKLKAMGYTFVQHSGAPFDAEMFGRATEKTGMPTVLTHVPIERITDDTDKLIDEHFSIDCTYIGLGAMPANIIKDKDALIKKIGELEDAAVKMEKRGAKFFYHNHHMEFFKHGGKTVLEMIAERAPHVNFTLDTYWVQYGGADIYEVIEKLAGRIGCVHLKDYKITYNNDKSWFEPKFAPLGEGNMDFGKIIPAMKAAGTEYFIVEQDNATELEKPFDEVKTSAEYLKNFK